MSHTQLSGRVVDEIAAKYKKSVRQVLLRWGLQHDYAYTPFAVMGSIQPEESISILNFKLDDVDMTRIDELREHGLLAEMY